MLMFDVEGQDRFAASCGFGLGSTTFDPSGGIRDKGKWRRGGPVEVTWWFDVVSEVGDRSSGEEGGRWARGGS